MTLKGRRYTDDLFAYQGAAMTIESQSVAWDLSRFFSAPDAPEIDAALSDMTRSVQEFRKNYAGEIATLSPECLAVALTEMEGLQEELLKPQVYAQLLFTLDSSDPRYQILYQKTSEFGNKASRELLFFELELINLPDEQFALLENASCLSLCHHFLTSLRRYKAHTLPEREEQLLKQKALTGSEAFCRLFDELSASYRFKFTFDGKEQDCTGEELLSLLHHPDGVVRETAFGTFLNRHGDDALTYSTVFNTMALDHAQDLELRSYTGGPMEPTNLGNELSAPVVQELMRVTEQNYPLAQRYFRLKAKLLGLEKLKNTDLYAPVTSDRRKYSLTEARDIVLDSYGAFSTDFREIAASFFTEQRIDTGPKPGKSGGAFCMGITPKQPPYVLLNFTGTLRDISTLAHELGHGIHFVLAGEQRLLNYHPPLPLAETASVFGEMLLTRHLLSADPDHETRRALLCANIEDIIATTFRQIVLTRFEEKLHLERAEGLVTVQRISELWLEENRRLFGDHVDMIEPYRWGWTYISHFIHTRFYCYAYTFAELLVLALFRQYQQEGERFLPVYRTILSSGGSLSPADTVAPAGIRLDGPEVWQNGYDILAGLIDTLEATQ